MIRFYSACSLSDILSQLRNTRKSEDGSLSGSLDMLVDLDSGQTDTQSVLTVSITVDSIRLDSSGKIVSLKLSQCCCYERELVAKH